MAQRGTDEHLDRTFFALADRTRRAMLARLAAGDATVSELAAPHQMSLPAVMKHLQVLRDAGLIDEEKTGRVRRCRIDPKALAEANDWLAKYRDYWQAQLDELDRYVRNIGPTKPDGAK